MESIDLARELHDQIRQLADCCMAGDGNVAAAAGLSRVEAECLRELANGVSQPADLAQTLGVARSRISYLINSLSMKGLLDCDAEQSDGRCRKYHLTKFGKETMKKLQQAERQYFKRWLSVLPEERHAKLLTELKLLNRCAGEVSQTALHVAEFAPTGE